MAKTEDIEARLAAYVDGELDAAERAEIEKHLTTNPQHRQLIAELTQQRELLRGLPRAVAPAEVAETIHAQLERAVLLGDVDDHGPSIALRINRSSQFRAIAAVLLLTCGLAAAIYFLLPSPKRTAEIADNRPLPVLTEPAKSMNEPLDHGLTIAATTPPSDQERRSKLALGGAGGNALADGDMAKGGLAVTNATTPGEQMFADVLSNSMKRGIAEKQKSPVVVVIASDNPPDTNRQVTGYLTRNNLNWEAQTEAAPQRLFLGQQQTASGSRYQQSQVRLKGGEPMQNAPTSGPMNSQIAAQPLPAAEQLMGGAGINSGLINPTQLDQIILCRQVTPQQAAALDVALNNVRGRRLESPASAGLISLNKAQEGQAHQTATLREASQVSSLLLPATQPVDQTRVGGEAAVHEAEAIKKDAFDFALLDTAAERKIQTGDELKVSVSDQGSKAKGEANIRPLLAVDDNGEVDLGDLGTVKVEGLTETAASEAVTRKYADKFGAIAADAKASVAFARSPASRPATMPAQVQATGAFLEQPPASQPAEDGLVDVVIVVRPDNPATQPEAAPPAVAPNAATTMPGQ